ncbi:hypothetical protein [Deinococcus radiophilus]|uniref:Uncharacterized protein n=1 Tax=Deinococcus radiophilus TaxID=32062 RepID=A0A431VS77_9DEIO|nr:hypothetical protein [Deinococcus radiophilus]RTR25999.1 hypothetical protein EJ104_09095 [Deinococcus radiophilus]UFA51842.1 hypothetical protein LMT64_12395 [Deinococcus radiophilus]
MYEAISLAKVHRLPTGTRILTVGEWEGQGPQATLRTVTGELALQLPGGTLPRSQGRGEFSGVLRVGPSGHWLEVEHLKVLGQPGQVYRDRASTPQPATGPFTGMLRVFRYGQTLWGQCAAQRVYLLNWPSGQGGLFYIEGQLRPGSPLHLQVHEAEPLCA